jgi:hypothetical protein
VGDIHCPGHAAVYYATEEVIDRIRMLKNRWWIHSFWDGALGLYTDGPKSGLEGRMDVIEQNVSRIMNAYPHSMFLPELEKKDSTEWIAYTFNITRDYMYGYPDMAYVGQSVYVWGDYVIAGREKCEELLALSGYRLADVLLGFIKKKMIIPASPSDDVMGTREMIALTISRALIGSLVLYGILMIWSTGVLGEMYDLSKYNVQAASSEDCFRSWNPLLVD